MVSIKDKEFWTEFIERYRSFPCLWDVHTKEYSKKGLREEALQVLARKCREQDPSADKEYVRKRIANLRTAFSREYKKIESSKRTGYSTDSIDVPSLWYYDLLLFLKTGEISRFGHNSLSDDISSFEECLATEESQIPEDNSPSVSRPSSSSSHYPKRKKKTLEQHQKSFFEIASRFMAQKETKDEDEFDILGKRIAEHFRGMEEMQRLIAEKIITEVLITGRMNQLSINSNFNSNYSVSQTSHQSSNASHNAQDGSVYDSQNPLLEND